MNRGLLLVLVTCCCTAFANSADLKVKWNGGSFDLAYQSEQGETLVGELGVGSIPVELTPPEACGSGDDLCWAFGSLASIQLTPSPVDERCYSVLWNTSFLHSVKDCFQLGSSHWYGGPEVSQQNWPIEGQSRDEEPYVTGDSLSTSHCGSVLEPYWINSQGFAIYASRDNPLFVSFNSTRDRPGELCLAARNAKPYPVRPAGTPDRPLLHLQYTICSAADLKAVHQIAMGNFWAKPHGLPSERMMTYPIWSTWALYKLAIDQNLVADFAAKIRDNGFEKGQLEIDDQWESCYGQMTFDPVKFPDPALMVRQLHEQDFYVTLWVHPFINLECSDFIEASNYVVKDAKGLAALTQWWDTSSLSAIFDFTKPAARKWWNTRIANLHINYAFDGFKFDAGETNWLPDAADFKDSSLQDQSPNTFSTLYAENMELFGGLTEVRTGWGAQNSAIFFRMLDKDSNWGYDNGLKTLIPTLLQFGLEGYPYVLPDMIGGNGYGDPPDRELFIRWLQANVFMPAMQFSYAPWNYDQETVDIALKMTGLHIKYADIIGHLAMQSIRDGSPINRPIWWIDPTNPDAQIIDSEYLLGDTLLVAPVLEKGAVTRDIFLPRGHWRDENIQSQVWEGPTWLRDYPAPLDTLPYFTCVDC